MKVVCVLLLLCRVSSTVKHSMKHFQTVSHGVPDFPEFLASAVVDDVRLGYCDNKTNKVVFHKWIRDLEIDDPEEAARYSHLCLDNRYYLKAIMDGIMRSLNQSGGSHILQLISGCEWDDETDETASFFKSGYDGEDFIEVDPQTATLTALKPEALATKLILETDRARLEYLKVIYTDHCPEWLKKYFLYGGDFLLRTGSPSVSLQKSPSSSVRCFVTGFYPNRAAMFWRKDGEELYEDVEYGEILPNHDNTFQMSVDLNISAVKPEDWGRYECVFQLQGVKEDIVTKLSTTRSPEIEPPSASLVAGLVAGLLLLLLCIAGIFIWRRKHNKFQPVEGGQGIPQEDAVTTI